MRAGDKRRLGTTNLSVTALSMGCASLGGLYTPVSAADALATLQAAWDSGIRYFDVAPMYGLTRAEHLLGAVFARRTAARWSRRQHQGRQAFQQ